MGEVCAETGSLREGMTAAGLQPARVLRSNLKEGKRTCCGGNFRPVARRCLEARGSRGERAGWVARCGICLMGESGLQAMLHSQSFALQGTSLTLRGFGAGVSRQGPQRATSSTRPGLEQSSGFTLPPGGRGQSPARPAPKVRPPTQGPVWAGLQGWLLALCPYPRRLCWHHCPGRWQALFQGFSKTSQNIHPLTYPSPLQPYHWVA